LVAALTGAAGRDALQSVGFRAPRMAPRGPAWPASPASTRRWW
jgi:hypothetical protein